MRVVELNNSENWEILYSTRLVAEGVTLTNGRTLINPIPEIEIPLTLETFILAVEIKTEVPEGADWRFGGRVYQKIQTGLVVGGVHDAVMTRSRSLYLEQINLVFFEKISTSYAISVKVPKWFPLAVLNVWRYTGVDDTSEEILLSQEFANINFKLDQIQSQLL